MLFLCAMLCVAMATRGFKYGALHSPEALNMMFFYPK